METFVRFVVVTSILSYFGVLGHPADHREDTVLPFSLSPGNVNLETYYLNKYPKPSPGGQLKQQETEKPPTEGNGVQGDEQQSNDHAFFRTRRSSDSKHIHGGSGYHSQGQRFLSQPMHIHHHNRHNQHNAHHGSQYSRYNRQQQSIL